MKQNAPINNMNLRFKIMSNGCSLTLGWIKSNIVQENLVLSP